MKGTVKLAKVDARTNLGLLQLYDVRRVPTMMIFKNGSMQRQVRPQSSKELATTLSKYVD